MKKVLVTGSPHLGFVGAGHVGKTSELSAREAIMYMEHNHEAVVLVSGDRGITIISTPEMSKNFVEINGEKYVEIEKEPTKRMSPRMSAMLAFASHMEHLSFGSSGSGHVRKLPSNIDIIKEFGLIQQKKSKLSKWERDAVVRAFNRVYEKYE